MTEEVTVARPTTEEPSPESTQAESVLRKGSPRRVVLRVLALLGMLAVAGGGGYLGFRQVLSHQAKSAPMKRFSAAIAVIGNDMWVGESPAHEVQLDAFYLDVTEVPVRAYRVCMDEGACSAPATGAYCNLASEDPRDDHPINCVTYEQAEAFCAWAGKRLPSEEEWEHGARTSRKSTAELFPWGAEDPSATLANACGAECSEFFAQRGKKLPSMHDVDDGFPLTAPVGSFPKGATAEGLLDMAGNVWEWTRSPHCPYPKGERCDNDVSFVIRGGGHQTNEARTLEVTSRAALPRSDATETVGFRCAKDG